MKLKLISINYKLIAENAFLPMRSDRLSHTMKMNAFRAIKLISFIKFVMYQHQESNDSETDDLIMIRCIRGITIEQCLCLKNRLTTKNNFDCPIIAA